MEVVEQQPESGSRTKVVGGVDPSGPPKSVDMEKGKGSGERCKRSCVFRVQTHFI